MHMLYRCLGDPKQAVGAFIEAHIVQMAWPSLVGTPETSCFDMCLASLFENFVDAAVDLLQFPPFWGFGIGLVSTVSTVLPSKTVAGVS